MTSVGDYLKKLLYQYDCLVVPELGAFLTHYLPASYTEATSQYMPPRKRLAFNEALRLDDGILTNYIMLHESVTRDEALRIISAFVSSIKQQIRAAGSFTLEGIGLFSTNDEGKLQFHPELRHNFFAESFGLQPIQAQYIETTAVSLPVLVLPGPSNQSLALNESFEQEGKLMPMPVKRSPWYWAAATLLIGSIAALSYVSVFQPTVLLQSSLSPASLLRFPSFLPKSTAVAVRPATRNVRPVSATNNVPTPAVTIPTTPSVILPVAPAPVIVSPKSEKVEMAKKVPVAVPVVAPARRLVRSVSVKPFLVVAGSFSSRTNALRLRRQLVKAGFDDAYLMGTTRRNELIKVAAFGTSSLVSADSMMVKVQAITGTAAWLMRTHP